MFQTLKKIVSIRTKLARTATNKYITKDQLQKSITSIEEVALNYENQIFIKLPRNGVK